MDAEQAWQFVLSQLQMEMPRASFDTWVRDSRLLAYDEGIVTVGVDSEYARDWLEARLQTTVSQLLRGMLDRPIDVQFVVSKDTQDIVDEDDEKLSESEEGKTSSDDKLRVEVAKGATRYAEEVQPDRIVAPYAYAFRLIWFGDVTPKQFSLWIGFRQAVYFLWKKAGKNIRNIPWQDVCQYANMARASFFREIGSLNLPNLVERIEIPKEKTHFKDSKGRFRQIANLYRVHMDPPLVKADSVRLLNIMAERSGITDDMPAAERIERALEATLSLQAEDVASLLTPLPEGNDPLPKIKNAPGPTVMHVVHALIDLDGQLPQTLQQAAEDLHQRIISFSGKAHITLYFLEKVARVFRLTHAQTWLVAYLRKRAFEDKETGEIRDWTIIKGGYRTLARWAGVSPSRKKTVWEWLRYTNFAAFVVEIEPSLDEPEFKNDSNLLRDGERLLKEWDETDTRVFGIRLNEPLVSQLLNGGSETPDVAEVRHGKGEPETLVMAEMGLGHGENETLSYGGSETPGVAQVGLRFAANETHFKFFKVLKPVQKIQISSTNQYDSEKFGSLDEWVVGLSPKRWVLQRLFNNAHVSSLKQKELKQADPLAYVSWLLYAFSQTSIDTPVNYALSQLNISETTGAGGVYDELASYSPLELIRLAAATENGTESSWRRINSNELTGDALWDNTIGGFNRRIGSLFHLLTGADHPSPGKVSTRKIIKTEE